MRRERVVTEEFLRGFTAGDLVDVKVWPHGWSGPHKLLVYKIDGSPTNAKRAGYIEVELVKDKLKRWLMLGDQQVIRQHVPGDQKHHMKEKR